MDKIDEGEFNAIKFYLQSADRERWAEKIETKVNINLNEIINQGKGRLIEGEKVEEGLIKERFLTKDQDHQDNDNK